MYVYYIDVVAAAAYSILVHIVDISKANVILMTVI